MWLDEVLIPSDTTMEGIVSERGLRTAPGNEGYISWLGSEIPVVIREGSQSLYPTIHEM